MEPDAQSLAGSFVVEVGQRQAWPFVTFCDNTPTPPVETRLYLDAPFVVSPGPQDQSPLDTLAQINNLAVADVHVMNDGGLTVVFEGGLRLMASGQATADTAGEPWWLGDL